MRNISRRFAVSFFLVFLSLLFVSASSASDVPVKSTYGKFGDLRYGLFVPASYDEKKPIPLVVLADASTVGETTVKMIKLASTGDSGYILLSLGSTHEADIKDAIGIISEVCSRFAINDARIFGLWASGKNTLIENIARQYDTLFAATQEIASNQTAGFVKAMHKVRRGPIYNAAFKARNVKTSTTIPTAPAFDGLDETVWQVSQPGYKNIVIRFPQRVMIGRCTVKGPTPLSSFKIDVGSDGRTWQEIASVQGNDTKRVERFIPSVGANYIRLSTNEKDVTIAEFEVYAELATAREFRTGIFVGAKGMKIPYRLFIPENYDSLHSIPAVVFYHDSGQRGTDNIRQLGTIKGEGATVWALPENRRKNPCIVIAPQIAHPKLWRDKDVMAANEELLAMLGERYPKMDKNRIYGTGIGLGAEGLCNMAIKNPHLFAALHLVSGGPNHPVDGAKEAGDTVIPGIAKFANIPMWAMQAWDDVRRPISLTTKMINKYRSLGYNPRYTVFLPGLASKVNNPSVYAYEDPRLPEWLFAQNRRERVQSTNKIYTPIGNLDPAVFPNLSTNGLYVDFDKFATGIIK